MASTLRPIHGRGPRVGRQALSRIGLSLTILLSVALLLTMSAAAAEQSATTTSRPAHDARVVAPDRDPVITQQDDGEDHLDEGDDEFVGSSAQPGRQSDDNGEDRLDAGDDESNGSDGNGDIDRSPSSDDDYDLDDGDDEAGCRDFDDGTDRCLDGCPGFDDEAAGTGLGENDARTNLGCGLVIGPAVNGGSSLGEEPAAAHAESFDSSVPLLALGVGALALIALAVTRRPRLADRG